MAEKFHERFNIDVDKGEAHRRFMSRVHNDIFLDIVGGSGRSLEFSLTRYVASRMGERHDPYDKVAQYVGDDFYRCLRVLEACVAGTRDTSVRPSIDQTIRELLAESEIDLGIEWTGTVFRRTGAPALDHALVNEPLGRLADAKYATVVLPFHKGLQHLLQSSKRPEVLADVVTDMYEALEALAKIGTDMPGKDLSANAELFVGKVGVSAEYKKLLKVYIEYANEPAHQEKCTRPRLRGRRNRSST